MIDDFVEVPVVGFNHDFQDVVGYLRVTKECAVLLCRDNVYLSPGYHLSTQPSCHRELVEVAPVWINNG